MAHINRIELLVHPGFSAYSGSNEPYSTAEEKLTQAWNQHVLGSVAKNPRTVLMYFTAFPRNFQNQESIYPPVNKARSQEEIRRREYAEKLGDRFFLYSFLEKPNQQTLLSDLARTGQTFTPAETNVYAYGEYAELCVGAWKDHVIRELGIPFDHAKVVMSLSLNAPRESVEEGDLSPAEKLSNLPEQNKNYPGWLRFFKSAFRR